MESKSETLVELWNILWDGDGWTTSWKAALSDLSSIQATWTPEEARHSIWQIVSHVTFWRNVTLNVGEGLARPTEEEAERRNFEPSAELSEDAWTAAKVALQDSHRAIGKILNGDKPGFDRAKHHIYHDTYHLGQIMQLRAMMGLKPIV